MTETRDGTEGKEHGTHSHSYEEHAGIMMSLVRLYMGTRNWPQLSDEQRESFIMTALKQARILSGAPDFADHWVDIVGYNRLIADRLLAREQSAELQKQQRVEAIKTIMPVAPSINTAEPEFESRVVNCGHCIGSPGRRGMDTCCKCDGTGSRLLSVLTGRYYPNTEEGFKEMQEDARRFIDDHPEAVGHATLKVQE